MPKLKKTANRHYDHRIKYQIALKRDPNLFPDLKIPYTTAMTWIGEGPDKFCNIVTVAQFNKNVEEIYLDNEKLRCDLTEAASKIKGLKSLLDIFGLDLAQVRIASVEKKRKIIELITSLSEKISLSRLLKCFGMSFGRYHAWKTETKICPTSKERCSKNSTRGTSQSEINKLTELLENKDLMYMSVFGLCWYAKRIGEVFVSYSTWLRTIKRLNLIRKRIRIHPAKPLQGIRALLPNEIWHIDVTIIRLLNGAKVYIQSIIDNKSRKILAWNISDTFLEPCSGNLILKALEVTKTSLRPMLLCDGGSENFNEFVDKIHKNKLIDRIHARVQILQSNSLIERFFYSLKHMYLFTQTLDTIQVLMKYVEFYIHKHNELIPHSTHNGMTPDEVYSGMTREEFMYKIIKKQTASHDQRIKENRSSGCPECRAA